MIEDAMEKWARWCINRHPGGWPPITVLGKILEGLPSLKCVACNGRGRKPLEGGQTEECQTCNGTGKVRSDPDGVKVNPAFIRSTKPGGYIEDDSLMQRIDWLVCNVLTDIQQAVVVATYCGMIPDRPDWRTAQEYRRIRCWHRNNALKVLKLNHRQFRMLLFLAVRLIEEHLRVGERT